MLSVTDAVKIAATNLVELFPKAQKVRLEEVELSDDDQFWMITLSFVDPEREPREPSPLLRAIGNLSGEIRDYKVVKLSKETGEVRSIKMRERTNV